MRNFTGFFDSPSRAAWILGASGANWSSTIATPSSPTVAAMFPPDPLRNQTLPATLVALISTRLKSCWAEAAPAGSVFARAGGRRREQLAGHALAARRRRAASRDRPRPAQLAAVERRGGRG